jgi:N-acetylglucosaminyldiphosphoundecaprenol N-acetyl-beta-D-mannosaminyltransferase
VTKDAPQWMKRAGLQWFHRLLQEPGRLWKRYLINNPKFVFNIAKQLFRHGFSPRPQERWNG